MTAVSTRRLPSLALKKDRLDDKTVAAFRGAVADAARLIESEPDRFRASW